MIFLEVYIGDSIHFGKNQNHPLYFTHFETHMPYEYHTFVLILNLELKTSFELCTHHLVNHTFVNHSINSTKYIHCEPHSSWATSMVTTSFVSNMFCELHLLWIIHLWWLQHMWTTRTIWWTTSYVDYLTSFHELHFLSNYLLTLHFWTTWLNFMNHISLELLDWSS